MPPIVTDLPQADGLAVDVYRNLNDECYSVRAREGDDKGRVIAHADRVLVRDAEFAVQPGGRQRVREEERKNVHAFVRGTLSTAAECPFDGGIEVTYDPYEYDYFVTCTDEQPVDAARAVWLTLDGVRAADLTFKEAQSHA